MREELDIPAGAYPSYRVPRQHGMDANTKRLVIAAGAIAGALVVLVGAYSLIGHHSSGVPEIAADTRPLRTKPADPGGMQIAGQNDAIMGTGSADGDQQAQMAPPPETPEPQALKAQERQVAAATPAPAPAAAPAAPAPAPVAAAPAAPPRAPAPVVASAAPAAEVHHPAARVALAAPPVPPASAPMMATPASARTPAPSMLGVPPVPPGAASARDARLTGHAAVQLASLTTEDGAKAEWQRLSHKMPTLLTGRQPVVTKTEAEGRIFWRLRTAGFADAAQARAFCDKVKAEGGGCTIATF